MPTVDWTTSRIQEFRDGVTDVVETATAGDYQISYTWENVHTPAVIIIGAGWKPQTALGVSTAWTSTPSTPPRMPSRKWAAKR